MPKQLIVPGHTLPMEGALGWYGFSGRNGPGHGQCSCGATSEVELANTNRRKQWHREHKLSVLAAKEDTDA